jgi:tight adherence protein B
MVRVTALATAVLAAAAVVVALPTRAVGAAPPLPVPIDPGAVRDLALRALDRLRPARRGWRRDQQLPDALDRTAAALRSGDNVGAALERVAAATDAPLGAELRSVSRAIALGEPIAGALRAWARGRGASPDVQLVATALTIGARAGGELARAVDGVAATLRERHELRREVHALATQARASAGVLAVAPLVFTALVASIEPRAALFLVTEPMGLLCLAGGAALEVAGTVWMARITRSAG